MYVKFQFSNQIVTTDGFNFVRYRFSWFSRTVWSTNSSTNEMGIFCMIKKENTMAMNSEPHECVSFVQSTKIGTHRNKAIHSM